MDLAGKRYLENMEGRLLHGSCEIMESSGVTAIHIRGLWLVISACLNIIHLCITRALLHGGDTVLMCTV